MPTDRRSDVYVVMLHFKHREAKYYCTVPSLYSNFTIPSRPIPTGISVY